MLLKSQQLFRVSFYKSGAKIMRRHKSVHVIASSLAEACVIASHVHKIEANEYKLTGVTAEGAVFYQQDARLPQE